MLASILHWSIVLYKRDTRNKKERVFAILKDKTAELGLCQEPAVVMTAFELAII